MIEVLAECRAIMAHGSKSFALASRLLPPRLRDPVAATYAFCRVSDDAIDTAVDPNAALSDVRRRLDAAFAGAPHGHAADRGLAWVVARHRLPRAPFDALVEGYAWDVEGRRYADLPALRQYAARVAGSVGVTMSILMDRRAPATLERAGELGIAMQLTNIARDVGSDGNAGRIYLPTSWLETEEISLDAFVARPGFSDGIGVAVCRLLDAAEVHYRRAEPGIGELPPDCRVAIGAAHRIYRDIGRAIRAQRYDTVSRRAYVGTARKVGLVARSLPGRFGTPARFRRQDETGSERAPRASALGFLIAGVEP